MVVCKGKSDLRTRADFAPMPYTPAIGATIEAAIAIRYDSAALRRSISTS